VGLRNTLFVVALLVGLAIAWVPYILGHQGQQAVDQGQNLANKINIACSNRAVLPQLEQLGACQAAAQIKETSAPGQPGANGKNGSNGANGVNGVAGRGIRNTDISRGHLFVTYTDNNTVDLGQIVGKDGSTGSTGRGISSTSLGGPSNTDLIVSYSDHTIADVGTVVGKDGVAGIAGTNGIDGAKGDTGAPGAPGTDGRSVASVNINNSDHLIVTYDDNTTSDAGLVPAGPQGVGVQSVALQTDANGNCELLFTLFDPSSGQQTTHSVTVNQAVCPIVPPPTTTTEPPPTS
jgi:hypothetical protein